MQSPMGNGKRLSHNCVSLNTLLPLACPLLQNFLPYLALNLAGHGNSAIGFSGHATEAAEHVDMHTQMPSLGVTQPTWLGKATPDTNGCSENSPADSQSPAWRPTWLRTAL